MKTYFKRLLKTAIPPTSITESYQDYVIHLFGSDEKYADFDASLENYEQNVYGNVPEKEVVYLELNSVRKKILLNTPLHLLLSGATFLINLLEMLELLHEIVARDHALRFRYGWLAGVFGVKKPPRIVARRLSTLTTQITAEHYLITYAITTKLQQWQNETNVNISLEDFFLSISLLHELLITIKRYPSTAKNLIAYEKEINEHLQDLIPGSTTLAELASDASSWFVGKRIRVELLFHRLTLKRKINLAQDDAKLTWRALSEAQNNAKNLRKKIISWWHKQQYKAILAWQHEIEKAQQAIAEQELQPWMHSLQQGEINLTDDLFWLHVLPSSLQAACALLRNSLDDPLLITNSKQWVATVRTILNYSSITAAEQQDVVIKNIIKSRLIPKVNDSQCMAYHIIYDHFPAAAYTILNPDEQMIIDFLGEDANWKDTEQGKSYLGFLLGVHVGSRSNLQDELESLAQNLITRHWLVQPLSMNCLLRLHNLILAPSLNKSLLLLSTQQPHSFSQLIIELKSVSSKLDNYKQWTQLLEKTYYLFKHLIKLLDDVNPSIVKSAQQTLNELAYAFITRFSAELHPVPTNYLKEIVTVLSELPCIDPALQQMLQTIHAKWSLTATATSSPMVHMVSAQISELKYPDYPTAKPPTRKIFDQLRKSISILSTLLSQTDLRDLAATDLPNFIFSTQHLNGLIEFVDTQATEQQRSFMTDTLPKICSASCLSDPLRNKLLLLIDIFSPTILTEEKQQLVSHYFDKQSGRILSTRLACASKPLVTNQPEHPAILINAM